jgi:hypothetical protein
MNKTVERNKGIKRMGLAVLLMALLLVPAAIAQAESVSSIPALAQEVQTPRVLEKFMKKNLHYVSDRAQFGEDEYWQTPEEMLKRKTGDCEDYALFAQAVLQQMGYRAFILSVYWDRDAHTVVVFENEGRWNLFNLAELREVKADSLQALANAIETNWSYLGIMRQEGTGGVIAQKVQHQSNFIAPESIPELRRPSGLQSTSGARATSF